MESTEIGDKQITASSYYSNENHGIYGRLNHPTRYWCPKNNDYVTPWLQVGFRSEVSVDGVDTQGGGISSRTKTFTVSYGSDGIAFEVYKIDGVEKVNYQLVNIVRHA